MNKNRTGIDQFLKLTKTHQQIIFSLIYNTSGDKLKASEGFEVGIANHKTTNGGQTFRTRLQPPPTGGCVEDTLMNIANASKSVLICLCTTEGRMANL